MSANASKNLSVAVIGTGEMGSGVSKRLLDGGARVKTSLAGRSRASRERIASLGIPAVESMAALVEGTDLILSIIPPGEAVAVAREIAALPRPGSNPPAFVECNAISPRTARQIAEIVEGAGFACIDGGIMGGPPKIGYSPIVAVSGAAASRALALREFGIDIRVASERMGDASALKMSYAGMTKGFATLATTVFMHAEENGISEQLLSIFSENVPLLWKFAAPFVPKMFPKAYRWIAEMREISAYMEPDPVGMEIYAAAAKLYERIAADYAAQGSDGAQALARLKARLEKQLG